MNHILNTPYPDLDLESVWIMSFELLKLACLWWWWAQSNERTTDRKETTANKLGLDELWWSVYVCCLVCMFMQVCHLSWPFPKTTLNLSFCVSPNALWCHSHSAALSLSLCTSQPFSLSLSLSIFLPLSLSQSFNLLPSLHLFLPLSPFSFSTSTLLISPSPSLYQQCSYISLRMPCQFGLWLQSSHIPSGTLRPYGNMYTHSEKHWEHQ